MVKVSENREVAQVTNQEVAQAPQGNRTAATLPAEFRAQRNSVNDLVVEFKRQFGFDPSNRKTSNDQPQQQQGVFRLNSTSQKRDA